jgi:hypothetical protein
MLVSLFISHHQTIWQRNLETAETLNTHQLQNNVKRWTGKTKTNKQKTIPKNQFFVFLFFLAQQL